MSDSLFYCDIDDPQISGLIQSFRDFSEATSTPVYIIQKALGTENKYEYSYNKAAVIMTPKSKITILDYGNDKESFSVFCEDFLEDLGYLSDKYDYKKILGRPRDWKQLIYKKNYTGENSPSHYFALDTKVEKTDERKVELLISLLIGSINNVDKVGIENPETLLDKVKHKIILFDGMQSRFIYADTPEKHITIQGLAGTGKTELLLHKLQKTYVRDKDSRLAFTCFNKVLAADMKNRIPSFFNFMKVEEQIEWDKRLWVFPSWGSQMDCNSGLYSYICRYYNIEFRRYSYSHSFEEVCKDALSQLTPLENIEPCFDYIFVDESQDFTDAFFDLCSLIAKKKVYIAGDIFQNIFDTNFGNTVDCDYLLNKCYRTDPRTLMFAHSVGMGLYERPIIRWLEDKEWEACGYQISHQDGSVALRRSPIRRFEDVADNDEPSIQLISSNIDEITQKVLEVITEIKEKHTTVEPDDVAIVFLSNTKKNYEISDNLVWQINWNFGWEAYQGYVTKSKEKGKLFISNTNNIKGLEFPFIICVETNRITDSINKRNSIYMILTRSFLTSYFIVNNINEQFLKIYGAAAKEINKNGFMYLREPSQDEKEEQAEKVRIAASKPKKSIEDIINDICKEYPKLEKRHILKLYTTVPNIIEDETEEEIGTKTRGMIRVLLGD